MAESFNTESSMVESACSEMMSRNAPEIDGIPYIIDHGCPSASTTVELYPRLHMYFEHSCDRFPNAVALQCNEKEYTYRELDNLANRMAQFLRTQCNVRSGSCVCIFLRRSLDMYVSVLAVLKCNAAFVPIDPAFPTDRLEFMAQDSGATLLLSTSDLSEAVKNVGCPVRLLDNERIPISQQPPSPPAVEDTGDRCCYIIYTSGSTGKPKGVPINHSNICNFISVALPLYGVSYHDRVYQGITIAFDFSFEEIWPTFAVGATLVAGPTDHRKLGPGLAEFLQEKQITVMHCVPTLLQTIDRDLPLLRIINVGAEACSEELVNKWGTDRVMLNTYGPTETTGTTSVAYSWRFVCLF